MSTLQRLLLAILLCAGLTTLDAQTPSSVPDQRDDSVPMLEDLVATQNFQRHVDEYVALHRLLETVVPPLRVTPDIGEVHRVVRALGLRIQVARVMARQGDLITPDVARTFRRTIAACLSREQWTAILGEMAQDEQGEPVPPPPSLQVNMEWPEGVPFDFVPPQLLRSLPALPPELQYRIIGRSLVLWDHHANLIVDFLPSAFATTT